MNHVLLYLGIAAASLVSLTVSSCKERGPESAAVKSEEAALRPPPSAPTLVNRALTNPSLDLDIRDFDASEFPETPESPEVPPEVAKFGINPSIGGYEVWPGYKIMDLSTWKAQDTQQGPFEIGLAECFRKSYWRLYKILQNPPSEYLKMVKDHDGPSNFYVFINDVRNGNPSAAWHDKLVNYQNNIVKWLGHWDGKRCTQRTRKDLIDFSVRFSTSHPPGWRRQQ